MPAYRASRFIEHLDGPITYLDTATIELSPSIRKLEARNEFESYFQHPLTPISEIRSLSPDLELKDINNTSPASQSTADQKACLSPTSLYSRATDDSKSLTATPDSSFLKQEDQGAHFLFHDGAQSCDTRQLFENTTVPAYLLLAVLAVLTGEGSIEGVKAIRDYRLHLPKFQKYTHGSDLEEAGFGEGEEEWLGSQQAYENHEDVVLAQTPDETYAEDLSDEYDSLRRLASSRASSRHRSEDSLELKRVQTNVMYNDDVRGRSLTPKTATAARKV